MTMADHEASACADQCGIEHKFVFLTKKTSGPPVCDGEQTTRNRSVILALL